MNPEKKFWYEIKAFNLKNNCELSFTRVENTASWGTPDILGYNRNRYFFTIELVKALSLNSIKLYEGKVIKELDTQGLRLEACSSGLEACFSRLAACGLPPAGA